MDRLRIDKWLWAARFYKTRSLAVKAVEGGKVRVNGDRVKPSRELKVGDEVAVRIAELEWVIEVRVLGSQRGSAAQAALLYAERADSRARREQMLAVRKAYVHPASTIKGRPTKKDRRQLQRLTEN